MAEQHVKVFQGLGMDQATIDKIESLTPEDLKTWTPDEATGMVRSTLKNNFLNDADFLNAIPDEKIPEATKKKIESGQYARFQNEILETAKKQLGLEDKDLEDMTEEDKRSIKKTVAKIAEKYLSKKGNVQGLQEMQKELQKLNTELEEKETNWQTKLTKELEEVNGKTSARLIKSLTKVELAQLSDVDLGVPVGYITDPILAKLQAKYTIVLDDNDNLAIKQKANPELNVLVDNKELTFAQALKNQVLEDKVGVLKTKKEDKKEESEPRKRVVIGGGEGGEDQEVEVPSFISDKIQAKIDAEEKA